MATAILYIRVSTDEQAAKGYSQRSQEERLLKYCRTNNINVIRSVFEDYSAKTFKRPDWSKMMSDLNHNKTSRPNLILFTRWDRFSRNTADAYYMINILKKLGIEAQAIDQSLDLSIPENKMLLAVYIATSEIENDRRSLNVKYGIRKAKKEGRWMGHAPIGYTNKVSESGIKYIAIHEPEASIIKRAFHSISKDHITLSFCYRQSVEAGLRCSRGNFYLLMHNPVYCGKIVVPGFEDEKQSEVNGLHEPLISIQLFNEVQKILKENGRPVRTTVSVKDKLLFRGFLKCPICMKKMSGSASTGSSQLYYYYHCHCGYRTRADKLDFSFQKILSELIPYNDYTMLYKDILKKTHRNVSGNQINWQAYITKNIDRLIERSVKAKELLALGDIDSDDYLAIKADCERRVNVMGIELQKSIKMVAGREHALNRMVRHFSHPDIVYQKATTIAKRKLLSIMFPKEFIFDSLSMNNNLSFAMQHIFNLNAFTNNKVPDDDLLPDNETTKLCESQYSKVVAIENKKGCSITQQQAMVIIGFLHEFAEIALESK